MEHRLKILETGFANVMFLHTCIALLYDYLTLIMTAVINSLILQRQYNEDITVQGINILKRCTYYGVDESLNTEEYN